MALINKQYVFLISEKVSRGSQVSSHPVESGIDITDNVKRQAKTLEIEGEIVGKNAKDVLEKIQSLHDKGKLICYVGVNSLKNAIITKFDTDHNNSIKGGCSFSMSIQEIKIADSPYKKTGSAKTSVKTNNGTKQIEDNRKGNVYHIVKNGETAYIIAQKYSSKGCTLEFILKNNVNAPKVKGDWTTLQVGTKLLVYKK